MEIVSLNDTTAEVEEKAQVYLGAGPREVWVVGPFFGTAQVWTADARPRFLADSDLLESPLLPGFSVSVSEFFKV